MTQPRLGPEFFLHRPDGLDDPFADLAALRTHHPVYWADDLQQWFVFRHDDVTRLLSDPLLTADRMKGFVDAAPEVVRDDLRTIAPLFESWLLMKDGEAHHRLRRALHVGFSLRAVQGLREPVARAAAELLARAKPDGRLDFCAEVAFLLPAYVLSDFLGVAPQDRDRVVAWSVDFVDFFNEVPISEAATRRMVTSCREMDAYTRELIAARRRTPQADFLGGLVAGQAGPDGLSDDEIVGNAMLLLLAGHVAVRNLAGNLLWLLLERPDQMAALRADRGLLHNAIEEALRFEPPVTLLPRIVLTDFELRGQTLRAGQIVQLSLAAANRDPERFPDPEVFDIRRKPGKHLSFGSGAHACLGALLAREQTTILVNQLLDRAAEVSLDPDGQVTWYRNAGNRGPDTLPVILRS